MTDQRGDDVGPVSHAPRTSAARALDQASATTADDAHVPEKQIQRWIDDGGAQVPDSSST